MSTETLLGCEAIALGAVHAGLSGAFAYPGTPSTEIMETLQEISAKNAGPSGPFVAQWCANEKTAYESALGASFAGRRTMVSMKHVGLNVAMDPFVNSALVKVNGGLVVVVADDPSMHSSQDEQDSRWLADFARVICLEPSDQQEAYDMTRKAFELSEKHESPVMIRITTRLAHARSLVNTAAAKPQNPVKKAANDMSWTLMPAVARRRWKEVLEKQKTFNALSEGADVNPLSLASKKLGVVTTGNGLLYYKENLDDLKKSLGEEPSLLHVGMYPMPKDKLRKLAAHVEKILVVEDGYPYVERELRGILPVGNLKIMGRETGEFSYDGELSSDNVRAALGLPAVEGFAVKKLVPPGRPPQLCQGCPHADSAYGLKEALKDFPNYSVNSDIGCYTLSALPPYSLVESVVDMGASVGMARGAGTVGLTPAVAVIGDSTFYHSGLTNLIDAVSHKSNVTVVILDNDTTGMTGAQPTILPSSRLTEVVKGVGIDPEHVVVLRAHKNEHAKNVEAMKRELAYEGPSVIIMVRECLEALKKARKA